jgi:TRAP transporter TAXI family solute receptor
VFYPYGGGLARILSAHAKGVQATAEVTGGSVDNVKLVHTRQAEIGFSTIDSAADALTGAGAYQDAGPQKILAIASLYDSFVHVVARADAGIASIADLKGKRVSVGSAGSSTEAIADRALAAAGIDPATGVTRDNLSVSESAGALKDGKVDAFFWVGGLPTAAISDLTSSGSPDIVFLETGSLLGAIEAKHPGMYRAATLPKGTYPGMDKDVPGLKVANVLFVHAEMKPETVTLILATIFDHLAEVRRIHPDARALDLASAAAKTALPLHPAAAAFYASRGAAPAP